MQVRNSRQLVLQYLAAHRRIARRDAAELCKVHPKQASRILARLTRRDLRPPYQVMLSRTATLWSGPW